MKSVILSLAVLALATPAGALGSRHAIPSGRAHQRSALRHMAAGCFHVAPRQWICPDAAPKVTHSQVGDPGGFPPCTPALVGTRGSYITAGWRYTLECRHVWSLTKQYQWVLISKVHV